MSEVAKTQESGPAQVTSEPTTANVEVDKSIPEPTIVEPTIKEQAPADATPAAPAVEEQVTEKAKENEKPEDLARSLLKGFQNKLAGVFPKKAEKISDNKEDKKEAPSDIKEEIKDDTKEVKETKERRSASRKRNSFFGGLVLGKKDEKSESEEAAVIDSSKDVTEPKQSAETNTEQVTDTATGEVPAEKPAGPFKRASIFGTLKNQFARKEKHDVTATAKDSDNVTTTAPVIPAVGTIDIPALEGTVSEAVVEKAQEIQATVEAKAEKITSKADRRKSALPFGLGLSKKEKQVSSDDEANEKPLSPFARIRATVRSRTSPKHAPEKKEELTVPAETNTEKAVSQPLVTEPEPAVTTVTPTVAASA
ncbi:putative immunogenic protein [Erysiphe necator]|uniref:Putative immunogenic protein n=1 Tax=Uncinula necator TaxID=52586 RepID=A0A0B1PD12_UNCNE|nr:putative immunogenic protein [Erysiphe necator]